MAKLTAAEVQDMVEELGQRAKTHGAETAHIREDDIHRAVLSAIATKNCDDPVACAAAAIKSLEIKFNRHCAK